jgi:hypothetical protein
VLSVALDEVELLAGLLGGTTTELTGGFSGVHAAHPAASRLSKTARNKRIHSASKNPAWIQPGKLSSPAGPALGKRRILPLAFAPSLMHIRPRFGGRKMPGIFASATHRFNARTTNRNGR